MYGAAHGLAYLLDPRFIGDGLSQHNKHIIEEVLFCTPIEEENKSTEKSMEVIFTQYTAYFISATEENTANEFRYQMFKKNTKYPLQY